MIEHYKLDFGFEIDLKDQGHHFVVYQEPRIWINWNVDRIVLIRCKNFGFDVRDPTWKSTGATNKRMVKHSEIKTATKYFIARCRRNKLNYLALALLMELSNVQYIYPFGAELKELIPVEISDHRMNEILHIGKAIIKFTNIQHPPAEEAAAVRSFLGKYDESRAAAIKKSVIGRTNFDESLWTVEEPEF